MSQFASLFAGGGGGGGGYGGDIRTSGGSNRSINFNGPSGGAVDGLASLLAYANGGPPANGGSFGSDERYFSQARLTTGYMPMLLIGGGLLLAVLLLRK